MSCDSHVIILLQEVAEIIKNSMDSFVVHLLLRLFEPATATSRLAHYSRYMYTNQFYLFHNLD